MNVLILMGDDLAGGLLETAHGNTHISTPNLDAFYAQAVCFEQAFATNPECVPVRYAMMTGRYPTSFGVQGNTDSPDGTYASVMDAAGLAKTLQKAGYVTKYGGKTHVESWDSLRWNVFTGQQGDALIAAVNAMINQTRAEPWLYMCSLIQPHDITQMAIDAFDGVNNYSAELTTAVSQADAAGSAAWPPLPSNYALTGPAEPDGVATMFTEQPFRQHVRTNWTDNDWRKRLYCYYRLLELFDTQVGNALAALDASGYADNTIVIVTGDHGDMLGAHKLEHKSLFYRESIKVPFYVRVPGVSHKVDNTHLVNHAIDLLPTLCDYAGIAAPAGCVGVSLRPAIEGTPASWRDHIILEGRTGFAAYDGRHLYWRDSTYPNGTVDETLFDHDTDPGELVNQIDNAAYSGVKATLSAIIDAHVT